MTFDDFFTKLQENQIWFDQLPLAYPNRNIKAIAREFHAWCLALDKKTDDASWPQLRVIFQKFLWQAGESPEQPKYDKAEPIQMAENALKRGTPEYIAACQKMLDMIRDSPMWQKPVPVLDADEEGAERKKPHAAVYPSTTAQDLYAKQRHIEYIKQNYDAVTGEKKDTWIKEEEFNTQYDAGLI